MRFPPTSLGWMGALGLLIAAVFFPVLRSDFVNVDDGLHIVNNSQVSPPSRAGLSRTWISPQRRLYIPLTYSVWTGLAWLSGSELRPALFHAANVALHTATTFLLFVILLDCLSSPFGAFLGAAVFALHPLQVETVAWISGTKDTLSVFFSVLSFFWYGRHLRAPKDRAARWYVAGALSCLAALLSKPSAVMVPLWIGFGSVTLLRRPWREALRDLLPWGLLCLPFTIATMRAQGVQTLEFVPPSLWGRCLVAGDAVTFYLQKLIWPWPLALDYGRSPAAVLSLPVAHFVFVFVALVALGFLLRRQKGIVALFLIPLLPVLGFQPFLFQNISTVADRYVSLSLVAVAVLVAKGWPRSASGTSRVGAGVLILVLGTLSARQVGVWKNSTTLLTHAIQINPQSWLAYNNLGVAYEENGRFSDALVVLQKAAAIRPSPTTFNNLGAMQMRLGDYVGAASSYERALGFQPREASYLNNLGLALLNLGKTGEARRYFVAALTANPQLAEARLNLQKTY